VRITPATSLVDYCFIVCTAMERAGTQCVLTGGSAATFYAPNAHQSLDADFVIMKSAKGDGATAALSELGFTQSQSGLYKHAESVFTLEFPAGPLGIGDDLIAAWDTIRRDGQVLYVITRTDSVRDRLSSFYYYSDRSALSAAVDVAKSGPIEMGIISAWSRREGQMPRFREFEERLH